MFCKSVKSAPCSPRSPIRSAGPATAAIAVAALWSVVGSGIGDVVFAAHATAAPATEGDTTRAAGASTPQQEADAFLHLYSSVFQRLFTVDEGSNWLATTDVTPEHDGMRVAAGKASAAFSGDPVVIDTLRRLRAQSAQLDALTVRQLEKAWLDAAEAPGTIPDVVNARIEAESRQSSTLDSFEFCLERNAEGSCVKVLTANQIDDLLLKSRDLAERQRVWEASKESGKALKPGLIQLQKLRNAVAKEMGYDSFFALQVADYGMTVPEMMAMLDQWLQDLQPLYVELHTWAKYSLAKRYNQPVPKSIPAHWLGNRWSQSWPGLVDAVDLDALFKDKSPEQIVKMGESFYVSMGFPSLPPTFWERSDLYPVDPKSGRKKNTHASAWHIDLDHDVRSLMSVESNAEWFGTVHHELGHIYYYLSYTRPEVPVLLRAGANRGFHEGIGEQITIAAFQAPYLRQVGILPEGYKVDPILWLLNEALTETVTFLPWAAGTMSHWEHDLYEENLSPEQWNKRWWEYVAKYQGVEPPAQRAGEELCDPATKTHVNDDPAQYYDYALATVLKYQLHNQIAKQILKQPATSCSYYGSKETGTFLRSILEKGATQDWRKVLVEATGEPLSTRAMMEYFQPLYEWLQKENKGRQKGW
jgi:peptidyl-dipeptidase A